PNWLSQCSSPGAEANTVNRPDSRERTVTANLAESWRVAWFICFLSNRVSKSCWIDGNSPWRERAGGSINQPLINRSIGGARHLRAMLEGAQSMEECRSNSRE